MASRFRRKGDALTSTTPPLILMQLSNWQYPRENIDRGVAGIVPCVTTQRFAKYDMNQSQNWTTTKVNSKFTEMLRYLNKITKMLDEVNCVLNNQVWTSDSLSQSQWYLSLYHFGFAKFKTEAQWNSCSAS